MINSCNEWDPLEAIVVGEASMANWPVSDPVFAQEMANSTWKETPPPSGPVAQHIVDQANRELDTLCEVLLNYGATVYRPKPMNFVERKGLYNYCPRDRLLIAGDTVVDCNMMYSSRNQEIENYYRLLADAKNIITMPRDQDMVLDAANICRLGDTWLFLESASGNMRAHEWLQRKFRNITIELCNFYSGVHIDSTVVPLREGLVLLNAARVNESNCPTIFKTWDKIYVDQVVPQGFYQYPYASKWIALNMLAIDSHTVIVDRRQAALIKKLEQWSFTVITHELRHSRTLGGGFHCVTLDTWRD
jgi:glycine amidinotransferase/scyllo-inosamine-4-phosphate amidinotransferase 1